MHTLSPHFFPLLWSTIRACRFYLSDYLRTFSLPGLKATKQGVITCLSRVCLHEILKSITQQKLSFLLAIYIGLF